MLTRAMTPLPSSLRAGRKDVKRRWKRPRTSRGRFVCMQVLALDILNSTLILVV